MKKRDMKSNSKKVGHCLSRAKKSKEMGVSKKFLKWVEELIEYQKSQNKTLALVTSHLKVVRY
jgi:hypothetical protein